MKKKQLIAIAVACVLVVLTGIAGVAMAGGSRAKSTRKTVIGPYVSVIPIYGTIGETSSDLFGNETSLSAGAICDYLDMIAEDENNKGVFLSIDSPGGYVYDTDKIYQALMEYKKKTGRPVTAACYSMMCSGAYYIACAADKIYAERTADVGSIGVYMEHVDVSELCKRVGVSVEYIRSSENKAMGNYYNPLTEEQRAILQADIDECYDRFLGIVKRARGFTDDARARAICDGRSYTANQGLQAGLIDGIKEVEDVLDEFRKSVEAVTDDYPYVKEEDWLSALVGRVTGALPMSDASLLEKILHGQTGKAMYYAG